MSTTSISEPSGFLMCSICVCLWAGVPWPTLDVLFVDQFVG